MSKLKYIVALDGCCLIHSYTTTTKNRHTWRERYKIRGATGGRVGEELCHHFEGDSIKNIIKTKIKPFSLPINLFIY
jgi:hypothetical protein